MSMMMLRAAVILVALAYLAGCGESPLAGDERPWGSLRAI